MIDETKKVNYSGRNIDYLPCFKEGFINSNELPKSVTLTKYNPFKNTFNVRLQFSQGGIEVPISILKISGWLNEIKLREAEEIKKVTFSELKKEKVEEEVEEEVKQENDVDNNEVFYLSL